MARDDHSSFELYGMCYIPAFRLFAVLQYFRGINHILDSRTYTHTTYNSI